MKRILIPILILMVAQIHYSQDWRKVIEKSYPALNGISFINENEGWCVSSRDLVTDYAYILHTTDGGDTWEKAQFVTAGQSLYSVYFQDAAIGYVGGDDASLYKTINGGTSWDQLNIAPADGDVDGIHFADMTTGWILISKTSGGQIMRTTDGGSSWNVDLIAAKDLLAFDFVGSKGIVTGKDVATIYYTTDGILWQNAPTPALGGFNYTRSDVYGVDMIDENTAYAVGWGSRAAGLQPSINLKSTDGGATWTYMTQPEESRQHANFYGVYFKDALNGISVGGASYEGSIVMGTSDGGINWNVLDAPFGVTLKTIVPVGDKIIIIGGNGIILNSPDFGSTWEMKTEIPSSTLYNLTNLGGDKYVASGFDGAVLISEDAGNTWNAVFADVDNICPSIQDQCFISEDIGYAVRNYGMVSKTTDGGYTWFHAKKDTSDLFQTNYGVHFLDENYGFVVGRIASNTDVIYKTTDAGQSWSHQSNVFFDDLRDVYFHDMNSGVVVGDKQIAGFTNDGGTLWSRANVMNVPGTATNTDLTKVCFYDASFGIAVGDIVIKTTDGGENWDYVDIPGLDKEMKGAVIKDLNTWWVSGSDRFYETTDGGVTWNDLADLNIITSSQIYDTMMDDEGYPWISASESNIYTTSPLVGIEIEDGLLPFEFDLSQNYPNPFNPSTKIKFTVPAVDPVSASSKPVTLKVYDVLGNQIQTLINKDFIPGEYEVEFDAGGISSGIYFYVLRSGSITVSRKMVLIK